MVRGDVNIQELPTVTNFCDLWLFGLHDYHQNDIIQHLELHIIIMECGCGMGCMWAGQSVGRGCRRSKYDYRAGAR